MACCLTAPLPEPMLIYHWLGPLIFFWGQIHQRCMSHESLQLTWKLLPSNSINRHTLVCDEIVDYSDVVGPSPVGAAPTTSSFSNFNTWLQWIGQRQLQDETRKIEVLESGVTYIRGLTVIWNFIQISMGQWVKAVNYRCWHSKNCTRNIILSSSCLPSCKFEQPISYFSLYLHNLRYA